MEKIMSTLQAIPFALRGQYPVLLYLSLDQQSQCPVLVVPILPSSCESHFDTS